MSNNTDDVSRQEKIGAILDVARFNPRFTAIIVCLGLVAAAFEGLGLSFILPIIELVQVDNPTAQADGLMRVFVTIYQFIGIPLTLGSVVIGVSVVMIIRYTSSFLVGWFKEALRTYYIRDLQRRAFNRTLNAHVRYFNEEGSDDILNAIITQTFYAGRVIARAVQFLERSFISLAYLSIALLIAPQLTLGTVVVLGGITFLMRSVIEPGYELGDTVAETNERRQEAVQAGTQGIRDIRLFGIADEVFSDFLESIDRYTEASVKLRRNEIAINRFYNLAVAISVFVLIYFSLTLVNLTLGSLGVFLFAMFRLGPAVSQLNKLFYKIENDLPHLVRTQQFIVSLEERPEPAGGTTPMPDEVDHVEFNDVWFSYDDEEMVLRGINFEVEKNEFIAFVGQSGAGKSTIVSLLARLYEFDEGTITADGTPIDEFDIDEWRDHISVVRQNPYLFDDTLEYNLTIGNRDASRAEINRACEIAKVDEFFDELPEGYETVLGDDGVRLSGGQKQRVALARALLEESDILILDEATSDLDTNLEKEVQRAIEEMERDYAIITIAHRLSTVNNADRIYTLENGEIAEVGNHHELVSKDGQYAELYTIQSNKSPSQ